MKITPGLLIGGLLIAGVAYVAFTEDGKKLASSILGGSGGFSSGGGGGDSGGSTLGGVYSEEGASTPGNLGLPEDQGMNKSGRTGTTSGGGSGTIGGTKTYSEDVSSRVAAINEMAGFDFLTSTTKGGAVEVGFGQGVQYSAAAERARTTLLIDQIVKYPGFSTVDKKQVYIVGASPASSVQGSSMNFPVSSPSSKSSGSSKSSPSATGGLIISTPSGTYRGGASTSSVSAGLAVSQAAQAQKRVEMSKQVSSPAPVMSPAPSKVQVSSPAPKTNSAVERAKARAKRG